MPKSLNRIIWLDILCDTVTIFVYIDQYLATVLSLILIFTENQLLFYMLPFSYCVCLFPESYEK